MSPMLARLAEKEPEAIVPLSKLGELGFRTANIYFEVDGETLARVLGEPLVEEMRIKQAFKI